MSDRWTSPGSPDPDDRPDGPDSGGEPEERAHGQQGSQPGSFGPPPGGAPPPPPQQGWTQPHAPKQPPGQPQGWGTPPAGYGQQPGWSSGPGGYGPAPAGWYAHRYAAAKPGVIPLRPLGVGEILDGAVSTARAHWRAVLGIVLAIAVVTELLGILAVRTWFRDTTGLAALENNPNPSTDELNTAFSEVMSLALVTGAVALLGTAIATAMLTLIVSRAVLGENVTIGEVWADARPQLLRLLGLILLVGLIVALAVIGPAFLFSLTGEFGLSMLAVLGGLVLGVWLWVNLSLAAPALILEQQRVRAALGRSWALVKGAWWRVFGIQLLVMVLVFVFGLVIEVPVTGLAEVFSSSPTSTDLDTSWTALLIIGAGSVIASVLTLPLSAGVTALLYIDQRIRREALDLDLARAAGLDGPRDGQ